MENKHTTRINMKCPSCNKEIDADSKFCEYCGTRIKNSTKGLWITLGLVCALILTGIVVKQSEHPLYIDLGLPSGTLWKNANEGGNDAFYTYDEAVNKFGEQLPTIEQLEELENLCKWDWITQNRVNGYKITGPNGNSIFLPAAGYRNCNGNVNSVGAYGLYWSSTPYNSDYAWYLYFYSSGVRMRDRYRCSGQSVRLVRD